PKASGTGDIADLLRREGVIENVSIFELYAYLNRGKGALKAGEFQFRAGTSIQDAIDTLVQGKAILHALTIPEGLTSEQIVQRLRDNEILTGDLLETPREGSLLPDTYKFERGMTRQQVVNLMQVEQRKALASAWSRRSPDLGIRTPQELVILASIVEKETGVASERPRVAGVFVNRLARRMKLQSDPTIVYGLVGGRGTLGRGITREEITRPTPYNTYVIEGLPPGPIANPGRAALEAAANPVKSREVYFVADGTGGHAFAETLDQHNRNVARWRQIERDRATAGAAATEVDRLDPPSGPEVRGEAPLTGAPLPATASAYGGVTGATSPGRGFDASEGTPLDPLRNTTWDLNSEKNVPSFGPPPGTAAGARREARPASTGGQQKPRPKPAAAGGRAAPPAAQPAPPT
ncbi:MAG: endolytic transglycosylase MltG, partial [Methylobacteriaceae bacterium]|nr:endolytic transglycosylase MltG [Methylobacteriaceae bacterium]